jgi:hypothetical protein
MCWLFRLLRRTSRYGITKIPNSPNTTTYQHVTNAHASNIVITASVQARTANTGLRLAALPAHAIRRRVTVQVSAS